MRKIMKKVLVKMLWQQHQALLSMITRQSVPEIILLSHNKIKTSNYPVQEIEPFRELVLHSFRNRVKTGLINTL